jgi:hypothetical protein
MNQALTPKQQIFCDEYLIDMNATRAALRAGYSATTALNGALMRLPKIKDYLDVRIEERMGELQISRDVLLNELAAIAFANMGNYYDEDGEPKPLYLLSEDEKAALCHMKTDKNGALNLKMYNKLAALKEIAKLMRFNEPKVEEPKPVYVYLDKADIDADDRFEDDSFDLAEHEKEADALKQKTEDEYQYIDKAGKALFECPLPYGPMADVYSFDIHDLPNEIISKLNVYESLQKPVAEFAAAHGGKEVFKVADIRSQFSNWLELELWMYGVGMSGNSDERLYDMFKTLRSIAKMSNDIGTPVKSLRYADMPERLRKLLPERV